MKIPINNNQTVARINPRQLRKFVDFLVPRLQRMTPQQHWSEISLLLTDNVGMSGLNSRYFQRDRPTDVISIPYKPMPDDPGALSGEVIINLERALEVAPSHGGCEHELALYIAHGCDHLAGADDADKAGYSRMRRRELRWLRTARKEGLIEGLLCMP